MNAPVQIKLTEAENALLAAYNDQVGSLPGNGDVLTARDSAISEIKSYGLPTRRVEAWHYTDLRSLLKRVPVSAGASVAALNPLIAGSTVLPLLNGAADDGVRVDGASVRTIESALVDGSAAAAITVKDHDDAIGRINAGFVRDGYEINVADSAKLESPLELQAVQGGGNAHGRYILTAGAGSSVTVIERQVASGDAAALVSTVSDIVVGEGAELTWIVLQQQGLGDTHLGQLNFSLEKDARLKLYIVNAGGKLVRQEVHGVTVGEGADFTFRVINLLGGESHTDVTMTLGHDVPETTSTEIVRNVVFDKASGVFQGQIRVAPDAQKTDARMACNTLLLSEEADFSTKPELEIFADDVQCAHGATVADIDSTHLYYLMARGIPEKKARALLVQAFVAEIVEELEDEALVAALEAVIEGWLERHGH